MCNWRDTLGKDSCLVNKKYKKTSRNSSQPDGATQNYQTEGNVATDPLGQCYF